MTVRKKMNSNGGVVLIGALLVLAIILVPFILEGSVVSGYDGIISEVVGVQYNPREGTDLTTVDYGGTYIHIDEEYDNGMLHNSFYSPTGLRCAVSGGITIQSQEQVHVSTEPLAEGGFQKWAVNEVKTTMGMSIRTTEQGGFAATDITFTIQLKENDFSVFSYADEQYAFILAVSTYNVPVVQGGQMETTVMESGHNFVLNPIATYEPPAWVEESGFTGLLSNFAVVQFDIDVISALPTLLPFSRTEAEIKFDIEVDVLVFGYWEVVQDPNKYDIQPDPNPFAWLVNAFGGIGDGVMDIINTGAIVFVFLGVFVVIVVYFFFKARGSSGRSRRRK